jgi:hypothetical protein
MGEIDIKKEWPNLRRMQVLGAKVVPATEGGKSLREAVDSACEYKSEYKKFDDFRFFTLKISHHVLNNNNIGYLFSCTHLSKLFSSLCLRGRSR